MTIYDRLLALTGVIPPFVLLVFAERFERRVREPFVEWRYRILAAAGLASIPIAWLERGAALLIDGASEPLYTLFEAFIIAATIEESGKFGCLLLLTRGALAPRTRYGAFLYALHASMGFALVENVIAMLKTPDLVAFSTRWILRAYMTVPMHLVAGGVLGYLWARRKFDGGRIGLWGGLGVAILIHGTYDAALLAVERLPDAAETAQIACVAGAMAIPLLGVVALRMCAGHLRTRDWRDDVAAGARGRRMTSPGSVPAPP
ncbi:MAG: PrsW family glutamic-type intramembrane protease [Myxococcales bacterium]|nr:PrsW family glutamic-type intramembrane protease [Myxococcales bacterium]